MKKSRYDILMLVLLLFAGMEVLAQKKKKSDAPVMASIKQREAEFHFTEGEKYFILEDYAKALVYYQKALELNPENATIHYKVAQVRSMSEKQDDLTLAALSIDQALKFDKTNKFFYLLAGEIYSGLMRFDKAAQAYENMIRNVPDTEEYLYELAAVYQYDGNTADAIKAYDRAEAVFGVNEISSLQKQRLYLDQGKKDDAIQEGQKLIEAYPDEEQYITGFAETLSQLDERIQAIELLESFLKDNKNAPGASVLLAGLYRDSNQEEKSRILLLSIFDNPEVELNSKLIVLGTYNEELSRDKSQPNNKSKEEFATQLFEKLSANYPDVSTVHVIGGDLFISIGKPGEAQTEYLRAIDLGETAFEVWQNLLLLETQSQSYEKVVTHSERALEYFPNQAMIYYFNGLANARLRKFNEAIVSLELGKKLAASNPALKSEINTLLGDAYHGRKEYQKSDQAYDEALSFNPDNEAVLNNYSYYLALRKSNLEKAEKMSSQLIKNHPDNAAYLDTHAWVLFSRQKYKEAKKTIERAIGTGQANATHFEHYGDILYKLGDVNDAVKQWEKARGMLGSDSEVLNKKISNRRIYE